jgi:hypothetical protein
MMKNQRASIEFFVVRQRVRVIVVGVNVGVGVGASVEE